MYNEYCYVFPRQAPAVATRASSWAITTGSASGLMDGAGAREPCLPCLPCHRAPTNHRHGRDEALPQRGSALCRPAAMRSAGDVCMHAWAYYCTTSTSPPLISLPSFLLDDAAGGCIHAILYNWLWLDDEVGGQDTPTRPRLPNPVCPTDDALRCTELY